MGGVSDLVVALAVLDVMKVRKALEEGKKSRQAEAFVPFNLPPLLQPGQPTRQSATEAEPRGDIDMSASHAW